MSFHSSHVDIAIIGAGAAGLAAAQRAQALGKTALVLEASERAGGRAYTDSQRFGLPVDLGCAWLHQADRNPLTVLARNQGLHLLDHEQAAAHYYDKGRVLDAASVQSIADAYDELAKRLAMASATADRSMQSIVASSANWAMALAVSHVAELDSGGEAADSSLFGVATQGDTQPNWLVVQGMGTVVKALEKGVRIALGQAVTEIAETARSVSIKTTGGILHAEHCIVTVSTGVLRAEAIRFAPALQLDTLRALEALPMGHFNKVILEFDQPFADFAPGDWLYEGRTFQPGKALAFLMNPFGSRLVIAFAGGDHGRALSVAPAAQTVEEVKARLEACLGNLKGKHLMRSYVTDWAGNPLFHGSYAYLRTGGGQAREVLARAGTKRIHFAGEATATDLAQTCGGAYLTGIAAAEKAAGR